MISTVDKDALMAYVDNWAAIDGLKPCNEEEFIVLFYKLLAGFPDEREVSFDGEGSYFGKQVTLEPFSYYGRPPSQLRFEVAYSHGSIRVYSANHNGFWYPEFIRMSKGDVGFDSLKGVLFNFLEGVFGL
jgi:hypothetical protein